ncbi:MAG: LysR family transcriptional regulator [Betaproteobacteria bacterium]|nr:LysR family transcriptional regulator [Betaproteobacteria bacterium]MBU6510803.1 LysR family transcriptional regulator [Betaproteobacteria bacterium]MDE1954262.1 LysR family transcriptional regulator [Betaproteobacteria bacterium]MDE2150926.1 LysR family transcriptional regulator [Betaproteobacteria bacterium]MDE2480039.1 LysR family transcriptional regulator [Betaproteobacteria bacterium]
MTHSDRSDGADRIELLRTFVRVVEAGSFSAVAAQTGTTQPTISRRLKALEREFGLALLHRSTHALRLTADGERCLERARELLAEWDALRADVRGGDDEVEGVLRVVVPHAFGQDYLVRVLADFLQANPKVHVEWMLHDDRSMHDYISAGIDCAIQIGEVRALGVVAIKLSEVPRVAAAAPELLAGRAIPQTPAELESLPWLALHTYYRNEIELRHETSGTVERVSFLPRVSTDSLYALRSAALRGLGVCVGSSWLLERDIAQGRLLRVAPRWQAAPLPIYLIHPHARFYPARLRRFVAAVREALPRAIDRVEDGWPTDRPETP